MKNINLHAKWLIKAPPAEVFNIMTDFEHPEGTEIDYTYQVAIHKRWLRIVAQPLIGWFSMKYWQKAVIDELRKRLER